MCKKVIKIATIATMILGIFSLMGCNKETKILKQGIYQTDDNEATITLYDDSLFKFDIIYVDCLYTGNYSVKKNKLILNLEENYELIFEVGDNQIVFEGAKENGEVSERRPIKVGKVFKKTEN